MAQSLTGDIGNIHLGYASLEAGLPTFAGKNFKNSIKFDVASSARQNMNWIYDYISQNKIDVAFGFDQPVSRPAYRVMRAAGIKLFVSYWGAPMSSINHGGRLLLKKIQVKLTKSKPDHFIFESRAMADTATFGRGISPHDVSVIHTGVDTKRFKPASVPDLYAYGAFNIPDNRRIVFYSGHMEERKGVHVIVKAANELVNVRKKRNVHFLFLGNTNGEEERFAPLYKGTETEKHVTFGGYRDDVNRILPSCYMGVIASTGWDSFPMSSLEMASSGLPLVASALQGIVETVEKEKTGFLVPPGDHVALADKIELLLDNPDLQKKMGISARERIVERFSRERQIDSLTETVRALYLRS